MENVIMSRGNVEDCKQLIAGPFAHIGELDSVLKPFENDHSRSFVIEEVEAGSFYEYNFYVNSLEYDYIQMVNGLERNVRKVIIGVDGAKAR